MIQDNCGAGARFARSSHNLESEPGELLRRVVALRGNVVTRLSLGILSMLVAGCVGSRQIVVPTPTYHPQASLFRPEGVSRMPIRLLLSDARPSPSPTRVFDEEMYAVKVHIDQHVAALFSDCVEQELRRVGCTIGNEVASPTVHFRIKKFCIVPLITPSHFGPPPPLRAEFDIDVSVERDGRMVYARGVSHDLTGPLRPYRWTALMPEMLRQVLQEGFRKWLDDPAFYEALMPSAPVVPTRTPAVTRPQAPEETPPRLSPVSQRWAVIVGVSEYEHAGVRGLKNLRYAARDAERLYQELVEGDPARWPKDNVKALTDKDASKEAVADAILDFLKKAQKDDLVLIFFSGHGSPDPARPKNNYFLCHDTDPTKLTTTGFPMWEIDNALERGIIEAQRVVVLADACHSGGFAPEGMRDLQVVSRNVSEGIQTLAERAQCMVVTSCEPGELSQERADWGGGHGAFAYALIKGLSGTADSTDDKNSIGNEDGAIHLDELVHYVRREVGDLTSNAQHVQDAGRLDVLIRQVGGTQID